MSILGARNRNQTEPNWFEPDKRHTTYVCTYEVLEVLVRVLRELPEVLRAQPHGRRHRLALRPVRFSRERQGQRHGVDALVQQRLGRRVLR